MPGREDATLRFRAAISGHPDGKLVFDVEAVPDRDFETNRCGFCVLHPIVGIAGGAATVEHVDGNLRDTRFPEAIEPWQPFKDMRAVAHEVAPGLRATCRMEGDTFEMEDQRNWSDASYKTYVRPLALPWPYRLAAGIAQRQTVTGLISAPRRAACRGSASRSGRTTSATCKVRRADCARSGRRSCCCTSIP